MFYYELKVRHEESGKEMNIALKVHDVEPLLLEVKEDLKVVGVPEADLSQYIPATFLAPELLVTPALIHVPDQHGSLGNMEVEGQDEQEQESKLEEGKVRCTVCKKPISKGNIAKHTKRHSNLVHMCVFPCQHSAKSRQELAAHQNTGQCAR